jgi:hypothetical protein
MCRRRVLSPLCASLAALALAGGGCAEFTEPYLATVPAGRIQGRVCAGTSPLAGRIEMTTRDEDQDGITIYQDLAADGSYGLDLPAGDYVVRLRMEGISGRYVYAAAELGLDVDTPDTVRVVAESAPITIDFNLGSLALDLGLSDAFNGLRCGVALFPREAGGGVRPEPIVNMTTTVNGGRLAYLAAGLLPGDYRVEINFGDRHPWDAEYQVDHLWLPGTRDAEAASWSEVLADSLVALSGVVPATPSRLEGRVVGAWLELGSPARPVLTVVDEDSTLVLGWLQTEADGAFAVDLVLPGRFKLLVEQDGVGRWFGGPGYTQADVYDLQAGQTISGLEIVQCGLRARISLPSAHGGAATLRLYDPVDLSLQVSAHLDIGSDLEGEVANLWPGTYLLEIDQQSGSRGQVSWRPQWFDRATTPDGARPILISEEGGIVTLDLTLEPGGVISGHAGLEPAGRDYCYIVLTRADEIVIWCYNNTWSSLPDFTFRGLPDGEWKLGALPADADWSLGEPSPDGTLWYPGTDDWNEAAILGIVDAGTVADLVVPVPPAGDDE